MNRKRETIIRLERISLLLLSSSLLKNKETFIALEEFESKAYLISE